MKNLILRKNIENYRMKICNNNNKFKYTYKLEKGISSIKGGSKVLNDLNYPSDIIDDVNYIIDKINI